MRTRWVNWDAEFTAGDPWDDLLEMDRERERSEYNADILRNGLIREQRQKARRYTDEQIIVDQQCGYTMNLPSGRRVSYHRWTPNDIAMLGSMPDSMVAERLGLTKNAVQTKRVDARIPAYIDPDRKRQAGRSIENQGHAADDREIIRSNRVVIEAMRLRGVSLLEISREFGLSYDVLRGWARGEEWV